MITNTWTNSNFKHACKCAQHTTNIQQIKLSHNFTQTEGKCWCKCWYMYYAFYIPFHCCIVRLINVGESPLWLKIIFPGWLPHVWNGYVFWHGLFVLKHRSTEGTCMGSGQCVSRSASCRFSSLRKPSGSFSMDKCTPRPHSPQSVCTNCSSAACLSETIPLEKKPSNCC